MKLGETAGYAKGDLWVIPQYEDYLARGRSLLKERNALNEIMTRPERIRTDTFSASGTGGCLRARQLAWLGMPKKRPDSKALNIFANGDYMHLRHQVAGLVGGYLAHAEVSVAVPDKHLTGTMDGLLVNGEILELKSINANGFDSVKAFGVKPEHKMQVHGYMYASGLSAARVVYENKNTQDLKEFKVERDEKIISEVVAELDQLNEATESKRLLPMLPECENKTGRYRWCPYKENCPTAVFASGERPRRSIRVMSSSVRS